MKRLLVMPTDTVMMGKDILLPVFRPYQSFFFIRVIIERRNNPVESIDDLIGCLFFQIRIHDVDENISAYMPYKTAVRLSVFDDVNDDPPCHLEDLIAAAEAVSIIKRLEVINIKIGKDKDLAGVKRGLYLPIDGNIFWKPCKGVDLYDPLGAGNT